MFECLLLIHEIATNAEIKNKYRFVYTQLKHRLLFPEKSAFVNIKFTRATPRKNLVFQEKIK